MRKFTLAVFLLATVTSGLAQKPTDQKDTLIIGGIRQVLWIKGDDDTKPLFLFLHGGPGNSVMPYAHKFCDQLYKHFVVVHWDQRASGETAKLDLSEKEKPLSLKIFQHDAEELVDSLLLRFKKTKLFVAGHSWGSALGFHLVRTKSEKISGYIAIGAMVNQLESERMALTLMKARALKSRDTTALRELHQIQIPFQNGEQLYFHRKGLLTYSGSKANLSKTYVLDWATQWLPVFNEASAENLFETLPEINCPIYFFAGRNDLQTNSLLVERYFNHVTATRKRFYWFEDAGHSIPTANGKRMQSIIIHEILTNPFDQKSKD